MDNINMVPWIAVYGVVAVSTIVSNLFFLFVVFKSDKLKRMRTTLFLIGLAAADLIVGAVAIPMFMAILWPGNKARNREAFDLSYYMIEIVSSFASLFLLAVIALERVYSVFWPYKHRALSKTPYYSAVFISGFLAALQMILYLLKWYNLITFDEHFYAMFLCMVAVVIVIIVSYFAMWRKIKTTRVEGLHQRRDERERKLAKSLAILTAVFLISWLPFFVVNALTLSHILQMAIIIFRIILLTLLNCFTTATRSQIRWSTRSASLKSAEHWQGYFVDVNRLQHPQISAWQPGEERDRSLVDPQV